MQSIKNIQKTFLLALIIGFFIAPSTTVIGQRSKNKVNYTYNSNKDNGETRIRIKNDKNDFQIEFRGEITISDDDRDIIGISKGGFIEIRKSSFGNRRRIVIESDNNGRLARSFYVGRTEKDYATEGKAWLAQILPEVLRSTTIGAESRVARFYKKGGAKAVLNEISKMKSDYVQSTYFKLLLRNKLTNNELVSVINTAGNTISSDHYLSTILKENQKAFLATDQTISAYINAAKSIDSDHYTTQVLKKVISDDAINDTQMGTLLEISKNISSDHYVTQVLTEVMKQRDLNTQNVKKIIALSKDIQSDHYKMQVLKRVINEKNMSSSAYESLLGTMHDIQSYHYMTQVINTLLDKNLDTSTNSLSSLLNLINSNVSSDHYTTTVYKRLARQNLTEDQLVLTLNKMTSINSDHYLSQTLLTYVDKVNRSSEKVKQAYRTTAKSINSTSYYGKAMKALN